MVGWEDPGSVQESCPVGREPLFQKEISSVPKQAETEISLKLIKAGLWGRILKRQLLWALPCFSLTEERNQQSRFRSRQNGSMLTSAGRNRSESK